MAANGGPHALAPTTLAARAFRRPPDLPSEPTDIALLRAVQMYLCGEPHHLVARLLGIRPSDLPEIASRTGWRFLEDCVRDDVRQVALSNLTRLTHKCFRMLDERLDKGDPIYDQNGDVTGYRAIKGKDLGNLVVQLMDKAQEIEHLTTKPEDNVDLLRLAKSLESYAHDKRLREATPINGESTVQ